MRSSGGPLPRVTVSISASAVAIRVCLNPSNIASLRRARWPARCGATRGRLRDPSSLTLPPSGGAVSMTRGHVGAGEDLMRVDGREMSLRLGVLIPTRGVVMASAQRPDVETCWTMARHADEAGYDAVWVGDSVVAKPRLEPLTTLAYIAGI